MTKRRSSLSSSFSSTPTSPPSPLSSTRRTTTRFSLLQTFLPWMLLLLLPCLVSSSTWSEDEDTITQYKLSRFGIRLSPTPTEVVFGNAAIETDLREALEETLFAHIAKQTSLFEYVLTMPEESVSWHGASRNRERRQLQESETTIVYQGAIVAFKEPMDLKDIYKWVEEAITWNLPAELNTPATGPFTQVTIAEYTSYTPAPTPSPVEATDSVVGGATVSDFALKEESNGLSRGKIIGFAAGGFLVLIGMALLVNKQRQQAASAAEIMRDLELEVHEKQPPSSPEAATVIGEDFMTDTGDSEMAAYESPTNGNASANIMDSFSVVSEYTVPEDASRSSSPYKPSRTAVYTENFDRETRLQKDMLQGEWSLPAGKSSSPLSSEIDSTEFAAPSGMSFEKAYDENQGEEVYLMPPSRKGQGGVSC